MILAAYLVTGFLVASVYAVGMLRGRRDRHHRLGLLIPLTVALIATPIQFAVGDTAARAIAERPADQVRGDGVRSEDASTDVTEYIYGRCTSSGVKGGIGIPGFDSFLVGFSTDTKVTGLDTVPANDRPPFDTMLHWAFDTMVGICTVADRAGALVRFRLVAQARHPEDALVPARGRACRASPLSSRWSAGWIVTEVGRQPWIVYNVMRTKDAVTDASGVWVTFVARARCSTRVLGAAPWWSLRDDVAALARGAGDADARRPVRPVEPAPPSEAAG